MSPEKNKVLHNKFNRGMDFQNKVTKGVTRFQHCKTTIIQKFSETKNRVWMFRTRLYGGETPQTPLSVP